MESGSRRNEGWTGVRTCTGAHSSIRVDHVAANATGSRPGLRRGREVRVVRQRHRMPG